MGKTGWVVHKFGGTSVGNAERYQGVSRIVEDLGGSSSGGRRAVVVSAMKGVTDSLIALVELAQKRDSSYEAQLEALKKRHTDTLAQLLKSPLLAPLVQRIEADFNEIKEVLRGVWVARHAADRIVELVSGFGEVWSAQILNALLNEQGKKSQWLDAREVLVVEPHEKYVVVDWKASQARIDQWLTKNPFDLVVITGFVASTPEGVATTLRRNGSDFSASIFGALLDASEIVIWTDVDGVLSADPRIVPDAVILDELSYQEVTEMAYFGAKVVHPATMEPAIRRNIPIWIKNTFNPTFPGTKIHGAAHSKPAAKKASESAVKGFSAIENMAVINVEGTGMIGVPGVAEKLFGALRSAGVSVVMISQASSEQSICFAIPEAQLTTAKKAVEQEFYGEIAQGLIQKVDVTPGCSIIAIVGDNMAEHPGVAGRFFSVLGKAGVNIRAIAQGSSERNISAVIAREDTHKALRVAHSAFYLTNPTLSVGVIGTGLIGKEFLRQLESQIESLKKRHKADVRIRAIMNSSKMLLEDRSIDLKTWDSRLAQSPSPADLGKFVSHLQSGHLPHAVIIDATASGEIPKHYAEWIRQGIHVITPNKKANAAAMAGYQEIRELLQEGKGHFFYSTNVGAGLPIIQTLRDLVQTGDRILKIEGILSGTLSFLFNSLTGTRTFSEIVKDARARGYTEPDPRDDLSGADFARKLVILAREIGINLELSDVRIESLVPPGLEKVGTEEFLHKLADHDAAMAARILRAHENNEVLRYIGTIDPKTSSASVQLKACPLDHPFARISGTDNIVAFHTARYNPQPLVIQGPGAGPAVTAAGVFADLLRLATCLGAPV